MIADLKIIDKCLKGELNGTLTVLMSESGQRSGIDTIKHHT